MAQFTNQQRTVAKLTRPVTESDHDVPGGECKETSMAFALEFERCIMELADEVYGLSKPKEIAQRVLRKACEFYDADWCGIFDADMMLRLWMPFWWYNRVMIILGFFEPPVRILRATIPENESHAFR